MIPTPPTSNVLNRLLWLGCHVNGDLVSTGSGVIIIVDGAEYLATALHVIDKSGLNPRVRSNGSWLPIDWQTVAVDQQHDVAVLKTNTVLDAQKIPVKYGEPQGMVYGGVGYVLGYPTWVDIGGLQTEHITEVGGRAMPIASLVVAKLHSFGTIHLQRFVHQRRVFGRCGRFPIGKFRLDYRGDCHSFPYRPKGCISGRRRNR